MKKKLSVILALAMLLQLCGVSLVMAQAYAPPESGSARYNFNIDWKFSKPYAATWPLRTAIASTKDAAGHAFYDADFDDSAWRMVSLPHTFNAEDSFRSVAEDSGDAGIYRGIAFYRKSFTLPEEDAGKKVIVEFESARQAVYVCSTGRLGAIMRRAFRRSAST